jgi:hypothetical protein
MDLAQLLLQSLRFLFHAHPTQLADSLDELVRCPRFGGFIETFQAPDFDFHFSTSLYDPLGWPTPEEITTP